MSRVVAIGEAELVDGYGLAGARVLAAADPASARSAFDEVEDEAGLLILTPAAEAALASRLAGARALVWVVLPCVSVERLRATLLEAAEAEARALAADAGRRAATESGRSAADSERLLGTARAEGEASAELRSARALALARADARRLVLEAKASVYGELRSRALAAALALRDDRKAYAGVLGRLEAEARASLGEAAELELDPPDVGGVRARAGRRSVDLTLPVLVEGCIGSLGNAVEELWR